MKKVLVSLLIGLGLTVFAPADDYAVVNYKGQMDGKMAQVGDPTFFVYDLRTDNTLKNKNFTNTDAATLKSIAEKQICSDPDQAVLINSLKPMYIYITDKQIIFINITCK
jgi:hypothetical protein